MAKAKGRPSSYTDEVADIICARLAAGESLRAICADPDMPSTSMVFRWLQAREDFRERYAHAREHQSEALLEEIFEIADDARNDWMERQRQDGSTETVLNTEHVQRSKLRIETRKWAMAKLAPKRYGDKLELSGKLQVENLTDEELQAEIAALVEKAKNAAGGP